MVIDKLKEITLTQAQELPCALYRAEQTQAFDRLAIADYNIGGNVLMARAGRFAFELLTKHWPHAKRICVFCGVGNNGGDGYVVAHLAQEAGLKVSLITLGDLDQLKGDAREHAKNCHDMDIQSADSASIPKDTDVIVDAIFGTGLEREVKGKWKSAIDAINQHVAPVMSIDIPSGLNANTGAVMGSAVKADITPTFITLKQGMFSAAGPEHSGKIAFSSLDVPEAVYLSETMSAKRIDWQHQRDKLKPLAGNTHKGNQGHLVIIGGDEGFTGAAVLCGLAALRSGTGLVSIITSAESVERVSAHAPELMVHSFLSEHTDRLIAKADAIAIGLGMGLKEWANSLFNQVIDSKKLLVLDADALNLLAKSPQKLKNAVLTPHPGEAARLLGQEITKIEEDRFRAAKVLQKRYLSVIILKGSGSVVQADLDDIPSVCSDGNPGMASAGMGDVLTGVVGAFLAQGYALKDSAELATCLHSAAADRAAKNGMRGLIASDLLRPIQALLR